MVFPERDFDLDGRDFVDLDRPSDGVGVDFTKRDAADFTLLDEFRERLDRVFDGCLLVDSGTLVQIQLLVACKDS